MQHTNILLQQERSLILYGSMTFAMGVSSIDDEVMSVHSTSSYHTAYTIIDHGLTSR
jgi:hypothetical protein